MATSVPVMSSAPAIVGRKLRSLDGLRAIAIIIVFFHHCKDYIPVTNRASYYFQSYVWQGWIGVDLFFVLSGFLITGILIDSRDARNYFSGFYTRRALRIFPIYYVVLIGFIVGSEILTKIHAQQAPLIASLVPMPEDRWIYLCYLTNWVGLWKAQWSGSVHMILAHLWSLAIEEQFYFFWPLIVWAVRPRAIPWIAGIVAMLSAIIRFAWVAHMGIQLMVPPLSIEIQLATICRLDALFIGALCAYFLRSPECMLRIHKWLPSIAILGVGSFFLAFSALLFFPQRASLLIYGSSSVISHSLEDAIRLFLLCGGFTLLALGFGALVLLAAFTESRSTLMQRLLKSRALAPIGKYSYGIYVFHIPILVLARYLLLPRLMPQTQGELVVMECSYIVALAAASYIVAALSYELFEKRILRLKRHFEPMLPAPTEDSECESAQ